MFTILQQKETGINFANNLHPTPEFNMFRYMYYYNGAGIGAGDFNNDGLIDLFFASNEAQNSIYLNQGKMTFKDIKKYVIANYPYYRTTTVDWEVHIFKDIIS